MKPSKKALLDELEIINSKIEIIKDRLVIETNLVQLKREYRKYKNLLKIKDSLIEIYCSYELTS